MPELNPLQIPKVKELLDKIPAEVRPQWEELFTAGFAEVRRLNTVTDIPDSSGKTFEESKETLDSQLAEADLYHKKIEAMKEAAWNTVLDTAILLAKLRA